MGRNQPSRLRSGQTEVGISILKPVSLDVDVDLGHGTHRSVRICWARGSSSINDFHDSRAKDCARTDPPDLCGRFPQEQDVVFAAMLSERM